MKILFEDSDVIVCVKPSGVLSQADEGGKENMIDLLTTHCNGPVFPLHRLDKEVSGVMVYAKRPQAAAYLSREIAERKFIKEYIALVKGAPTPSEGQLRDFLFKDSRKNKSFVVDRIRKGVKEALLDNRVLTQTQIEGHTFSVVWVRLHTGRTHQIRVQFASRKHPLLGDRKYGGNSDFAGIGLWSYKITFTHPKTKENLTFSHLPEAPLEPFFLNLCL